MKQELAKQMMSNLYGMASESPCFVNAWPTIEKLLNQKISAEIQRRNPFVYFFFSELFPKETIGSVIVIHGLDDLESENSQLYPGRELVKLGAFSFGKDIDGSQFCLSLKDFEIYQLAECREGEPWGETAQLAYERWASLEDFLMWFGENV